MKSRFVGCIIVCTAVFVCYSTNRSERSSLLAAQQQSGSLSYLTDDELQFVQEQLAPHFPKLRDPDPYMAVRGETLACSKWLIANVTMEPSQYIEPVVVTVSSLNHFPASGMGAVQNIESPESVQKKREFAFIWTRVQIKSHNPNILVTGIIRICDRKSGETVRVVHMTRRFELRDKRWSDIGTSSFDISINK